MTRMNKQEIKTAMILAAGKGTRMRAQKNDPPKPLVTIAGQSLLHRMMARLVAAGIDKIIINVHHKADEIEAAVAGFTAAQIIISDERDALLETGGGVQKALPLLGDAPFLVANADLLWQENTPAIAALIEGFEPRQMKARLLLASRDKANGYDGRGDYHLAADAKLARRKDEAADYIFAGVQILTPALFHDLPAALHGTAFSLNKIYDAAEAQAALYGVALDGQWMHVGTPEGRAQAEALMHG
jgi:MurNAc alpha-1-phosphate uridylyltransferase